MLLQLTPIEMVTISTEHTRSRKCHFLRQLLLLQLTPIVQVSISTEHTRSRKYHFFRRLLLLQLTPICKVTCTYQVQKMPLFEATSVTTAYSYFQGYMHIAHTRSRKRHFLRQLLLLQLTIIVMVTICTEHTRSRKCHFLKQLLLLQIIPALMVTIYIAHIRSRK